MRQFLEAILFYAINLFVHKQSCKLVFIILSSIIFLWLTNNSHLAYRSKERALQGDNLGISCIRSFTTTLGVQCRKRFNNFTILSPYHDCLWNQQPFNVQRKVSVKRFSDTRRSVRHDTCLSTSQNREEIMNTLKIDFRTFKRQKQ